MAMLAMIPLALAAAGALGGKKSEPAPRPENVTIAPRNQVTTIVGNPDMRNVGDILAILNAGSPMNGGSPYNLPSPVAFLGGNEDAAPVSVIGARPMDSKLLIGLGIAAAAVLFLLFRRRGGGAA